MARTSIHTRLPEDLLDELRATADAQNVSLNSLLIGLLAGSVAWTLNPGKKKGPALLAQPGPVTTDARRRDTMTEPQANPTEQIPHRNLPLAHSDRRQENGEPFKVRALLPELIRKGWRPGRSGRSRSIDVRLYFRTKPNGDEWGELAILDPDTGKLVKVEGEDYVGLPLHSPEALQWFVSELVHDGWMQHREAQQ
jgi:hypothetical protein